MQRIVLDTNILVSALLSPFGAPARILDLLLNGYMQICYDSRIVDEYKDVLSRPKFGFNEQDVRSLLDYLLLKGLSVTPPPLGIPMHDEDDRSFYEVACYMRAYLITGNTKHYPDDKLVIVPARLLEMLNLP